MCFALDPRQGEEGEEQGALVQIFLLFSKGELTELRTRANVLVIHNGQNKEPDLSHCQVFSFSQRALSKDVFHIHLP